MIMIMTIVGQVCWTSAQHLNVFNGWRNSQHASQLSGLLTTHRRLSGQSRRLYKESKKNPQINFLFLSSRALDAGACGIVAPMISTRDDAQRLVEQCRCSKRCSLFILLLVLVMVMVEQYRCSKWCISLIVGIADGIYHCWYRCCWWYLSLPPNWPRYAPHY